jgi:ribosomal protein RSM22 (predicted rRNA methylase)
MIALAARAAPEHMLGLELVRSLDESWRDTLDRVARARGWPTTRDVAKLSARVAQLSAAYNDPAQARASAREAGAGRLAFAFPRDVPKGAAAVRELVATRQLSLSPGGVLRVLDLGAGLGAMSWGLVRALAAAGGAGRVEATWVDPDREALAIGVSIVRQRPREEQVELRVTGTTASLEGVAPRAHDLVLVGNVLSELDVGMPDAARVERHASMLRELLDRRTAPEGALVVVEPALRDRTRHLHAVRDVLVAGRDVAIFAPCLHEAPCPALARESEWCHEDLAVDLPPWLVPVARAAGLRHEGLTFSYLVLRKWGAGLADALARRCGPRLRVVSGAIPTKGKHEAFLCGEFSSRSSTLALVPARARVARLDRDATAKNALWERLVRGDVIAVDPPLEVERARIGPESHVVFPTVEDAAAVPAAESGVTLRGDNESR